MKAETVHQMMHEWYGKNPSGRPTHLLLHPVMMMKLVASMPPYATIKGDWEGKKPDEIMGLEIVQVSGRAYPEDYAVIVGGNP